MKDHREITGKLITTDKHVNLVLDDCEEVKKVDVPATPQKQFQAEWTLGISEAGILGNMCPWGRQHFGSAWRRSKTFESTTLMWPFLLYLTTF